jgi:hypothetical protein
VVQHQCGVRDIQVVVSFLILRQFKKKKKKSESHSMHRVLIPITFRLNWSFDVSSTFWSACQTLGINDSTTTGRFVQANL